MKCVVSQAEFHVAIYNRGYNILAAAEKSEGI